MAAGGRTPHAGTAAGLRMANPPLRWYHCGEFDGNVVTAEVGRSVWGAAVLVGALIGRSLAAIGRTHIPRDDANPEGEES